MVDKRGMRVHLVNKNVGKDTRAEDGYRVAGMAWAGLDGSVIVLATSDDQAASPSFSNRA